MKTTHFTILCANLHLLSGSHAFTTNPLVNSAATSAKLSQRTRISVSLADETATSETETKNDNSDNNNIPSKQHLYGRDLIDVTTGETGSMSITIPADESAVENSSLPLPSTYITCGKCKCLFAISESDLGTKGKGCRVKCCVCQNSWYQSRDRLLNIPTNTHDLLPAPKSDLDRIAKNLSLDKDPDFAGVFKVYVGNLDWNTSEDELKGFFEENGGGEVCDVSVVTGPEGRSRGFAFVTFYDEEVGKKALELNGKECNGRELSVREPNN